LTDYHWGACSPIIRIEHEKHKRHKTAAARVAQFGCVWLYVILHSGSLIGLCSHPFDFASIHSDHVCPPMYL